MSYKKHELDNEKFSEQAEVATNELINSVGFGGEAASVPPPTDDDAAMLAQVNQAVLNHHSPLQFQDAIDSANSGMGNRAFLQFVEGLHARRDGMDSHGIAKEGVKGAGQRMTYFDRIQSAFGHHDVSGIRQHTDSNAQAALEMLGARAYLTSGHMALGGTPDLHTQAHEAAHAVQQQALGSALQLKGGIGEADDQYERHADAVADAVIRGESVQALLDQIAGGPTTVMPSLTGTGPMQMMPEKRKIKKYDDTEHKRRVRHDTINQDMLENRRKRGLLSKSGRFEMLELGYEAGSNAEKLLTLNEEFERALGDELEHHVIDISKRMVYTIGGYQDIDAIKVFIEENLKSPKEHIGKDVHSVERQNKIYEETGGFSHESEQENYDYSERNLPQEMKKYFSDRGFDPIPKDYAFGYSDDLEKVENKLRWLNQFKTQIERKTPKEKNERLRIHFRKIFMTVKLNYMLLSQKGYFGGSLEFKGDVKEDLEHSVYLMSTKTRVPESTELYVAPKPMVSYRTSETSLLPYGNQFSMSMGHAEFSSTSHIPAREVDMLEAKLEQFQLTEAGVNTENIEKLNVLANVRKPDGRIWTLSELLHQISKYYDAEDRRKKLYTDYLRLPWSERYFDDLRENPLHGENLRNIRNEDVRDPRILDAAKVVGISPSRMLASRVRANVVGRKANINLTPLSAAWDFRKKISRLDSLKKFDTAYAPYLESMRPLFHQMMDENPCMSKLEARREVVTAQAIESITRWYENARVSHKPIYAGPSGHTLGYLNLYSHAYEEDEKAKDRGASDIDFKKPTLEEARLVMLASLIGNKEHHSYDEVMYASHGISITGDEDNPQNNLKYRYPGNYGDVFYSNIAWVREAAYAARLKVYEKYENDDAYRDVLSFWLRCVRSNSDEAKEFGRRPAYEDTTKDKMKPCNVSDIFLSVGMHAGLSSLIVFMEKSYQKALVDARNSMSSTESPLTNITEMFNTSGLMPGTLAFDEMADMNISSTMETPGVDEITRNPIFFIAAILQSFFLISDLVSFIYRRTTASAYAIKSALRQGPQVTPKIMSTLLGVGLTFAYSTLNLSPEEDTVDAAIIGFSREAILLMVNNVIILCISTRFAYQISQLMYGTSSNFKKGSFPNKFFEGAQAVGVQAKPAHRIKVGGIHIVRSCAIISTLAYLQISGNFSSNPYAFENIVANLLLHLLTELGIDHLTVIFDLADEIPADDTRDLLLNIGNKALGSPKSTLCGLAKKPHGYHEFQRDPKLRSKSENFIWVMSGSADPYIIGKGLFSGGAFTVWSVLNQNYEEKVGRIWMGVMSGLISFILSYKRLRESGIDTAGKIPALIRIHRKLWGSSAEKQRLFNVSDFNVGDMGRREFEDDLTQDIDDSDQAVFTGTELKLAFSNEAMQVVDEQGAVGGELQEADEIDIQNMISPLPEGFYDGMHKSAFFGLTIGFQEGYAVSQFDNNCGLHTMYQLYAHLQHGELSNWIPTKAFFNRQRQQLGLRSKGDMIENDDIEKLANYYKIRVVTFSLIENKWVLFAGAYGPLNGPIYYLYNRGLHYVPLWTSKQWTLEQGILENLRRIYYMKKVSESYV